MWLNTKKKPCLLSSGINPFRQFCPTQLHPTQFSSLILQHYLHAQPQRSSLSMLKYKIATSVLKQRIELSVRSATETTNCLSPSLAYIQSPRVPAMLTIINNPHYYIKLLKTLSVKLYKELCFWYLLGAVID